MYDVMDIFRQDIIDRFVLKLLNRHMIVPEDFDVSEHGCFLSKDVNKKWVELYEGYMINELSRLGNITPRKWIQREVQAFMSYLKSLDETVIVTERENIS